MSIIDTPNKLPSVDRLLNDADVASLVSHYGAPLVTRCTRNVMESARHQVLSGQSFESADLIESMALKMLAKAFRELPIPVIGRITDDALWFDLRCLEDETEFVDNLRGLTIA